MSMMQAFRDGIDPNWKRIWAGLWHIAELVLALGLTFVAIVHYHAGAYDRATLDIALVILLRQRDNS